MLQIGFGKANITPTPGMVMPGGFFRAVGDGVLEKLWAEACVLYDGANAVALVGVDSLGIERETVATARRTIERDTKVPGKNVLVGASHTHSGGPAIAGLGRGEDRVYLDLLAKRIAESVTQAWQSLHAAEIGVGTGTEASIAFNRRFLMRDGREITHPGKPGTAHHPEIVRPAGPVDTDVGVLAARDPKGRIVGLVIMFSCHSTVVGGRKFSPDYAGYLRKHLRAVYGAHLPVVFLLGACGDVTQVDNMSPKREFGVEHADMMGLKLAAETVRTISRITWLNEARLAATTKNPPLDVRPLPDADRERPAFGLGAGVEVDKHYALMREEVAKLRARQPTIVSEVQTLRIGPLGIATNGSEYFAADGLRIKNASPFSPTWVVSLTNECIGYVPTAQAFMGGGYEPRTGRFSYLAIDSSQRLLEASLAGLRKLV